MLVWLTVFLLTTVALAEDRPAPLRETISQYSDVLTNATRPAVDCPSAVDFCRDPYAAICGDLTTHRDAQLSRADDLAKKVPQGQLYTSSRSSQLGLHVNTIKENLSRAIRSSSLPPEVQAQFQNYLGSTTFVLSSQLTKEMKTEPNQAYALAIENSLYGACGAENTQPKAFILQYDKNEKRNQQPRVVICDGMLDTSSDTPGNDLAARLFMVVGHELSHMMSSHWFPEIYQNLRSCVTQNQGQQMADEMKRRVREEMGFDDPDPQPAADLISAQMEEISCDHWARKAFLSFLQGQEDRSPESLLQKMRQSYGYFCGAPVSGGHPSGKFRVEFMANDSGVRQLMGCSPGSNPAPNSCER